MIMPQILFSDKDKIDAYLRDEIAQGNDLVFGYLKQAIGAKLKPFREAARQAGSLKTLFGKAVIEADFTVGMIGLDLEEKLRAVAAFIDESIATNEPWLSDVREDGVPKKLSGGFDKAVAAANRHLYGDKRGLIEPATKNRMRIVDENYGESGGSLLRPEQIKGILHHNLEGRFDVSLNYRDGRTVTVRIAAKEMITTFSLDSETRDVCYMGWGANQSKRRIDTGQLMANRMALAKAMDCPMSRSAFGMVGAYAFAKYGFLPSGETERFYLMDRVGGRWDEKRDAMTELYPEQVVAEIDRIFDNPEPQALWDVANLDLRDETGNKLGFSLLYDAFWGGTFDLDNAEQVSHMRDYIGADKWDDAFHNAQRIVGQSHKVNTQHHLKRKL